MLGFTQCLEDDNHARTHEDAFKAKPFFVLIQEM
jgi:hypothetical protein